MTNALLLGHILLTTAGYAGLIAANVYVLFLSRSRDPHVIRLGLTAWRHSTQVFGPLLLVGIFFGFGHAAAVHIALGSSWLVTTYGLIVAAIVLQAAVMIPWQLRSNAMLEAGAVPSMTPVALVLLFFCIVYTSILWLMLTRPG